MTTSLRQRRRELLREEIVHAAAMLIAKKGHVAMSMDELAAEVGISKPTLYTYFANKEEVVIAAAMNSISKIVAIMEEGQEHLSPLEHLSLILRTVINLQIDEGTMTPRPWRQEMFAFLRERDEVYVHMQRIDNEIVSLARKGIACGEIDPSLDPATVVKAFYALTDTLNTEMKSVVGEPNTTIFADALAKIFVQGVQPPCSCHTRGSSAE